MPRVWTVTWKGQRAREAWEVISRAAGGPFVCGGAGAVWTACTGEDPDADTLTASLFPVDPHDVDPTGHLAEAPMPDSAT